MANTAKLKKMNKVIRTEPIPEVAAIVDKAWGLLDAMRRRRLCPGYGREAGRTVASDLGATELT